LLRKLHLGETSRNRAFQRFADPAERRVLSGYRRVKGLAAELRRPSVRARLIERPHGDPAVELFLRDLRYHGVVLLTPWEWRFLREEMATFGLSADSGDSRSL
jgi:hypothetical protein